MCPFDFRNGFLISKISPFDFSNEFFILKKYFRLISQTVSVRRRLRTADCGPGVKCRLRVKRRLQTKGAFLWENPNPDSCIQKRILRFFT